MDSIIDKVRKSPFVYFGFTPKGADASNPWLATPLLCISDDGIKWSPIAEFPDLGNLRDGYIKNINGSYWIIGTLQMFRTNDFKTFESFSLDILRQPQYSNIWAPEFVFDYQNKQWKIVYAALDTSDNQNHIYFANFNPDTGKVSIPYQKINVDGQIDPDIICLNGKYILVVSSAKIYTSDNLMGPYTELNTNIDNEGARWFEATQLLIVGDQVFLYQDKITGETAGVDDSGYMVYAQASIGDLTKWTKNSNVVSAENMRHGSFLFNDGSGDPDVIYTANAMLNYSDDPRHVNTVNKVDIDFVDKNASNLATDIRRKQFGRDVREILARSVEWVSMQLTKLSINVAGNSQETAYLRNRFDNVINGITVNSEVIDARFDATGTGYSTLKNRLDIQQVNYGKLGTTLMVDNSDELMIIKGLSENSTNLQYFVVSIDNIQEIHSGIFTIDIGQLTIKEDN